MSKRIAALSLFLSLQLVPLSAIAFGTSDGVSAAAQIFFPVVDESRYLSIYSSQNLQQWQWRTGAVLHYSRNPLALGSAGGSTGKVISDVLWMNAYGSIGFFDWLQMGLDFPVALYEKFYDPNVASPSGKATTRMGDVRMEFKFRLVDIDQHNVGISLMPYGTFPTGDGGKFTGNNSFTGGIKLITDVDILDRAQIAINLGYLARKNFSVPGRAIRIDDLFTYGLGANVKITDWMEVIAEGYGSTVIPDAFDTSIVRELPLEADGGLRFFPTETLSATIAGGAGLTIGYGSPDFRIIASVAYTRPRRIELPPPPPPEPETLAYIEKKKIVITKRVHFEFDKSIIRPVSFPILQAVADILSQNPNVLKVRIEGHTDWIGSDAYNQKLSQNRANAVKKWLVDHRIAASRLEAVGYGEKQPIAENSTAIGRAKNRRVAFTILEQETRVPAFLTPADAAPTETPISAPPKNHKNYKVQ
ncbi:MAG: OmpA family protein [Deltaproteobacteria bacterium]|nr:OmpA family protein [Deltaproteobacteria bacterium]